MQAARRVAAVLLGHPKVDPVPTFVKDLDLDVLHSVAMRVFDRALYPARRLKGGVDFLRGLVHHHRYLFGAHEVLRPFIPLGQVFIRGIEEYVVFARLLAAQHILTVLIGHGFSQPVAMLVVEHDLDALHPFGLDRAGRRALYPARRLKGGVDFLRGLAHHYRYLCGVHEVLRPFIPLAQVFVRGEEKYVVLARLQAARHIGAVFIRPRGDARRIPVRVKDLDLHALHALITLIRDGARYPARRIQGGVDIRRGHALLDLHGLGFLEALRAFVPLAAILGRGREIHEIVARLQAVHLVEAVLIGIGDARLHA